MSSTQADLTVRRAVVVEAAAEHAFEVFTAGIATWWPLATHSLEGDAATDVAIEPRLGGAIYEDGPKGRQEWGEVTAWDPPSRLAFTWHLGRLEEQTEVEVTFTPEGGATRVELVHAGWERLEEGVETSARYTQGWAMILDRYAEIAAAA